MCRLFPKLFGIKAALALLFLLPGCNALFRKNIFTVNDSTVALQSIGLRLNDDTGAPKDYGSGVASDQSEIEITIPYKTDLGAPLTIYFTTNSSIIQVGEASSQSGHELDGDPWVSGTTQLSFSPIDTVKSVRLLKTQSASGGTTVKDYSLRIKKVITPKLLNPVILDKLDSTENASLLFRIVDESGTTIEGQENGAWMNSRSFLWYDSRQFDVIDYPPLYDSVEEVFKLEIKPKASGVSELFILNGAYEDKDGITLYNTDSHPQDGAINGSLFSIGYKPPAVYLSFSGDDNNIGLISSLPVKTWAKAKELAASEGISNINVVASDSHPYDVAGDGEIKYEGVGSFWGNISGGWREDFSGQYSGTPATIFFDSQQQSGENSDKPSSVFSYIYTDSGEPPFQPVLKDITIKVDPNQSSIDYSTALLVSGGSAASSLTITLNKVVCQASDGGGSNSNGVFIKNADAKIFECRISGRDASSDSRAIFLKDTNQVNIEQSQILGGNVSDSGSYGIDIDSPSGSFYIDSSVVSGGDAGNGNTYGIRAAEVGELNITEESTIVGGNATEGISTAIEALSGGVLNFKDCIVLAGAQIGGIDPDPGTENEVYGLNLENTKVTLNRVWVHSFSGKVTSVSVKTTLSDNGNYAQRPFEAKNSSFISGDAENTTGIIFSDAGNNIPMPVFLQNSVISVGQSSHSGGSAAGLNFTGSMKGYILNNTIHVKNAVGGVYGISLKGPGWPSYIGLEIRNNLIYSVAAEDLSGIISLKNIIEQNYHDGSVIIHNNNFWDNSSDSAVELKIDSGNLPPMDTIKAYHTKAKEVTDSTPHFLGNITQPVTIDMDYDYAERDFSIGEITTGDMPAETATGGEDLEALKIDIADTDIEIATEDKQGKPRSGAAGLSWSMGAYEYDTVTLPTDVYVDGGEGDDGFPLGTEEMPFATVARAYDAARTGLYYGGISRNDITSILVQPGEYSLDSTLTVQNTGTGLNISAIEEGATAFRGSVVPLIEFKGKSNGGKPTVFQSFKIKAHHITDTAAGGDISISDGSDVVIKNNVFDMNDIAQKDFYAIKVDGASPSIKDNNMKIFVESGAAGSVSFYGMYINNTSNHEITKITGNTINMEYKGNHNVYGIYIKDASVELDSNKVDLKRMDNGLFASKQVAALKIDHSAVIGKKTLTGNSFSILGNGEKTYAGWFVEALVSNTSAGEGNKLIAKNNFFEVLSNDSTETYGVYLDIAVNGALLEGNNIAGGKGGGNSSGIYITSPNAPSGRKTITIRRNKIYGAYPSAIHIDKGNNYLLNNLIHAGDSYAGHKTGIKIEQDSYDVNNPSTANTILHNIIYSENLDNNGTASLFDMGAAEERSSIINNLFIAGKSGINSSTLIGNFEFAESGARIALFLNNFIITTKPGTASSFQFKAGTPLAEFGYTSFDGFMNLGNTQGNFDPSNEHNKKGTYADMNNNAADYFKQFTPLGDTTNYKTFFNDDWNWKANLNLSEDPRTYGAWLVGISENSISSIITSESYKDYEEKPYSDPPPVGAYSGP